MGKRLKNNTWPRRPPNDIKIKKARLLLQKWLYFENFTDEKLDGAQGKNELLKALDLLEKKNKKLYLLLESYYLTNSRIGGFLYETQLPPISRVASLNGMSEIQFNKLLNIATRKLITIMENEGN